MSVGDLKNNVRKLQVELRAVRYEKDIDLDSVSKGIIGAFLPIYHYVFLEYSRSVAEEVANKNIELSGKTDLRFVEAMYKVLREMFSYKPPVTKEQLFANGFAERKVIMCAEMIRLIKNRHKALNPKPPKSKPGTATNQTAKLGPRSANTTQSIRLKEATNSKTQSAIDAAAKLPPRVPATFPPAPDVLPIQVVNEIRRSVECSISPTVQPIQDVPHPCPTHTRPSTEPTYIPAESTQAASLEADPITIETKVVRGFDGAKPKKAAQVAWGEMKAVVVNIGDQEVNQSSSYNPARYGTTQDIADSSDEEGVSQSTSNLRPIDIIPKTPARSQVIRADQSATSPAIVDALHKMQGAMGELTARVTSLQDRLGVVEGLLSMQQEHDREREKSRTEVISPEQLETLLARMTLAENKVSLLDAQQKSMKVFTQNQFSATQFKPSNSINREENSPSEASCTAPALPFSPICPAPVTQDVTSRSITSNLTNREVTINHHETPRPASDGDYERWSSTPVELAQPLKELELRQAVKEPIIERSLINGDSASQADRITSMLKSTEAMLNVQVDSPLKPTAQ